jgi:hypothetical protein
MGKTQQVVGTLLVIAFEMQDILYQFQDRRPILNA